MDITATTDSLASLASNLWAGELGLRISTAIMKQILDSQKQMGAALVEMIGSSAPSLNGTGRIVDVRA